MARKTKEEALQTRRDILDAALDVFYRQGVGKTSLEDIARAANVTRGAVYWHFKDKNDIFQALHNDIHTALLDEVATALEDESLPPLRHLLEFCVNILTDFNNDSARKKFFVISTLKCDYSGELVALLDVQARQRAEGIEATRPFFDAARKRGDIPPDSDTYLLSHALSCYVGGIFQTLVRSPDDKNLQALVRPMLELFFERFRR